MSKVRAEQFTNKAGNNGPNFPFGLSGIGIHSAGTAVHTGIITALNFVGASKIAISTLLLTGIWYAELTPYAAMGMAAFMLAAQLSHLRVKNPFKQGLPSLVFLLMSLFIALFHFGKI